MTVANQILLKTALPSPPSGQQPPMSAAAALDEATTVGPVSKLEHINNSLAGQVSHEASQGLEKPSHIPRTIPASSRSGVTPFDGGHQAVQTRQSTRISIQKLAGVPRSSVDEPEVLQNAILNSLGRLKQSITGRQYRYALGDCYNLMAKYPVCPANHAWSLLDVPQLIFIIPFMLLQVISSMGGDRSSLSAATSLLHALPRRLVHTGLIRSVASLLSYLAAGSYSTAINQLDAFERTLHSTSPDMAWHSHLIQMIEPLVSATKVAIQQKVIIRTATAYSAVSSDTIAASFGEPEHNIVHYLTTQCKWQQTPTPGMLQPCRSLGKYHVASTLTAGIYPNPIAFGSLHALCASITQLERS